MQPQLGTRPRSRCPRLDRANGASQRQPARGFRRGLASSSNWATTGTVALASIQAAQTRATGGHAPICPQLTLSMYGSNDRLGYVYTGLASLGIQHLSEEDLKNVRECLVAAVEGPFFPEWECHTLFGPERADMAKDRGRTSPPLTGERCRYQSGPRYSCLRMTPASLIT
jgi:hypothetical protein